MIDPPRHPLSTLLFWCSLCGPRCALELTIYLREDARQKVIVSLELKWARHYPISHLIQQHTKLLHPSRKRTFSGEDSLHGPPMLVVLKKA